MSLKTLLRHLLACFTLSAAAATVASAGTIDVCGTLVTDGAGCKLVELPSGERYILDDDGGLVDGQPIRVQGDFDPDCFSICFANDGCVFNSITTLGWPVDLCGTLATDGAGCKLIELDSGERYILDDDGGLVDGQPIRVQGDLDPTCLSICFANDGCIFNSVTTLGCPVDVCGTLVTDGAGCKLVELASGERYILDDDGGLVDGQPIRVQGDLDPTCFSICFANDGCINNAVTTLGCPVDVCGTLVTDGAGCKLVELASGERYILDDDGGLFDGQPIRVQGDLDPTCFSICFANDGCINNAVTTLGCPVDVCGTLVTDGAGCKLVELASGERYILDDDGGLSDGTTIRVQGDLDPTCFSICFANDGCIFNSVTTEGCDSPIGTNYCTASANSIDPGGAPISALGSASIASAILELVSAPTPDNTFIFYYGPNQINQVFGNGFRCVGGSTVRLPVGTASGNEARTDVDFGAHGANFANLGTVNFQCWYRDPAAGGAFFNLSDAVEIVFAP